MSNSNGYTSTNPETDQTLQINELMNMTEEEFDVFLDLIDLKKNDRIAEFAIWVHNERKRNNLSADFV